MKTIIMIEERKKRKRLIRWLGKRQYLDEEEKMWIMVLRKKGKEWVGEEERKKGRKKERKKSQWHRKYGKERKKERNKQTNKEELMT